MSELSNKQLGLGFLFRLALRLSYSLTVSLKAFLLVFNPDVAKVRVELYQYSHEIMVRIFKLYVSDSLQAFFSEQNPFDIGLLNYSA